jgi:hypothetical protein
MGFENSTLFFLFSLRYTGKILPKVDPRLVIGVTIAIVSVIQVRYSLK